jgi:hypothetical protein
MLNIDDIKGIICTSKKINVCKCGHFADFQCDFPIGPGKTCDLDLCEDCAKEVGKNLHVCPDHFDLWMSKYGEQKSLF